MAEVLPLKLVDLGSGQGELVEFEAGDQIALERVAGLAAALAAGREVLTANRTYYVRTDGSDSNTGLANTAGGAFLTLQKAVDVAASLDLGVHNVTVRCSGDFSVTVTLKSITGAGHVEIRGDASDLTSFSVSVTGGDCFSFGDGFSGVYKIGYAKLSTSSSGRCIGGNGGGGRVIYGNVDFGNAAQAHISVSQGQFCAVDGPITISGSSGVHLQAFDGGSIRENNQTITLIGTPAFFQYASAVRAGTVILSNNTYIGSATGFKYRVSLNGVMFVNGAGASYLPGDAAGITETGGQYV